MSKKILVIDDDESILDAINMILEFTGYDVEKTSNGEEVFDKVKTFHPDLILLDVLLSGMDGRQICKELKNTQEYRATPVVMISAHPSAQQGAMESGADDFLAKPFDADDLIEKVSKNLSQD